jgi:hypothetical protein
MSKQWDMLDICAERVTAAGVKQVLVIWKPTWEPVEIVNSGVVWDNWVAEQKTSVARSKREEEEIVNTAVDSEAEDSGKRRRGRPPKAKSAIPVLVAVAKDAAISKKDNDVHNDDDDDDDDGGSSGGDGSSSEAAAELEKIKVAQVVLSGSHAQAFVGTGKKVDKQPEAKVAVAETAPKRGRGRPPKIRK